MILVWCWSNTAELSFDEKEKCLTFKKVLYATHLACYPYESSESDPECVWDSLNLLLNTSYKDSKERAIVNWNDCREYSMTIIESCLNIDSERLKFQCASTEIDKALTNIIESKAETLPQEDIETCKEKQLEVYRQLNECYKANNVITYDDWSACQKDSNMHTDEERCRWVVRNAIKPCLEIVNYTERSNCRVEKISKI